MADYRYWIFNLYIYMYIYNFINNKSMDLWSLNKK